MKTKYLFIALAFAALVGCNKNETEEKPVEAKAGNYVGTFTAEASTGTLIEDGIRVNFTPDEGGNTCTLILYQARFSPRMLVQVDVTIRSVNMVCGTDKITLSCDNVVPLALGGEFTNYTVTDFQGEIKGGNLSFSTKFGSTPTTYSGTLEQLSE